MSGQTCTRCGLPLDYPYRIHGADAIARGLVFDVAKRGSIRAHAPEATPAAESEPKRPPTTDEAFGSVPDVAPLQRDARESEPKVTCEHPRMRRVSSDLRVCASCGVYYDDEPEDK